MYNSTDSIGVINKKAADETGLLEGTPVYIIGLDTTAAALAAGVIDSGQGFYAMGTAANMMFLTDKQKKTPFLESFIHITDPKIHILSGSQGSVGYSLKWFKDNFIESHQDEVDIFKIMSQEAEKINPGSSGSIYLPFLFGKYHPIFNQTVRGTFIGLNPTTSKPKLIRSLMEGCTFNLYEIIKSVEDIGVELNEIITSGGPSKSDLWCQIIADTTNRKVYTRNSPEGSPLGNAILVSVCEGMHSSFEEVANKASTGSRP